jgi:hypothetical protein
MQCWALKNIAKHAIHGLQNMIGMFANHGSQCKGSHVCRQPHKACVHLSGLLALAACLLLLISDVHREAGLNLELGDVAVQSLVPAPLQNVASADDFMQQLPQYDADLAQQVSEADAAGECLRFVGKI